MADSTPVVVFDTDPPVLLFHLWADPAFERVTLPDGWYQTSLRTACGRRVYRHEWRDTGVAPWSETRRVDAPRYTTLRRDHAEQIGRPCARCERAVA